MAPQTVLDSLKFWFNFPQSELHCQLSTTDGQSAHIRTILLYQLTTDGKLMMLSRLDTQKCRDIEKTSHAGVCFWEPDYGQIITEGKARILSGSQHNSMLKPLWDKMPKGFKNIYLKDNESEQDVPSRFALLEITPHKWEVLTINKQEYSKSQRTSFTLIDDAWQEEEINPM